MGVAAAAGLVMAAGCGGDDDGLSAAERRDYCEAASQSELSEPEVDFATATPEQLAAAGKEFASGTLRPLFDRQVALASDDVADDFAVLNRALTELERTGDFEAIFFNPEYSEAFAATHEFDLDTCDWETVDVKAVDYRFEDVSRTIDAGIASFELENDGKELHEIGIARKNDGVTETFDQILELPEEEQLEKVELTGNSGPGAPGEEGTYLVTDLRPGEYIMVCFLPQGATSMEALEAETEAPPHVALGMKQEFTVEA
jgi:hypothetical protein